MGGKRMSTATALPAAHGDVVLGGHCTFVSPTVSERSHALPFTLTSSPVRQLRIAASPFDIAVFDGVSTSPAGTGRCAGATPALASSKTAVIRIASELRAGDPNGRVARRLVHWREHVDLLPHVECAPEPPSCHVSVTSAVFSVIVSFLVGLFAPSDRSQRYSTCTGGLET